MCMQSSMSSFASSVFHMGKISVGKVWWSPTSCSMPVVRQYWKCWCNCLTISLTWRKHNSWIQWQQHKDNMQDRWALQKKPVIFLSILWTFCTQVPVYSIVLFWHLAVYFNNVSEDMLCNILIFILIHQYWKKTSMKTVLDR